MSLKGGSGKRSQPRGSRTRVSRPLHLPYILSCAFSSFSVKITSPLPLIHTAVWHPQHDVPASQVSHMALHGQPLLQCTVPHPDFREWSNQPDFHPCKVCAYCCVSALYLPLSCRSAGGQPSNMVFERRAAKGAACRCFLMSPARAPADLRGGKDCMVERMRLSVDFRGSTAYMH